MRKEQKFEQHENTGVLFVNDNKEGETYPDFLGNGNVNGEEVTIAAWKNKAKSTGKSYLTLRFSDPSKFSRKNKDDKPVKKSKEDDEFVF